jgi:hypothetical protein
MAVAVRDRDVEYAERWFQMQVERRLGPFFTSMGELGHMHASAKAVAAEVMLGMLYSLGCDEEQRRRLFPAAERLIGGWQG